MTVMVTWKQFSDEVPALADAVQARFKAHKHHVLATLRKDGSPRVSGTEVEILDALEANGVAEGIAGRFADIAQYGAPRQDWLALYMNVFAQMAQPMGELAGEERPADAAPPAVTTPRTPHVHPGAGE